MKKIVPDFLRRGLTACGFGPMVLAVLYLILERQGVLQVLTVDQVCRGIFSLSALAFVAGGMNSIYQVERLPLMLAVLIHGGVLYGSYLAVYLFNGWLACGKFPIFVFTGIFVGGYFLIWGIIYAVGRHKTARLNEKLRQKQKRTEDPFGE